MEQIGLYAQKFQVSNKPKGRLKTFQTTFLSTVNLSPFLHKLDRFFLHALPLCFLLVGIVAHFLRDFHRAEFGAAHRAEVGDFCAFGGQGFVVEALGAFGVEAEAELVAPAELETRLAQGVVAQLCARPAFGEVGGVGGEFVGNDAGAHVFLSGRPRCSFGVT